MLPNLIGQIVILQPVGASHPRLPEPYICVAQTRDTIIVTGTNGGFGSRVVTFNVADIEVMGYFESLEVIEQQLKLLGFSLNNELLSITPAGREALLEAQVALARVLENALKSKAEQSRAAEDYRTNRYRAEEDTARDEYFAQYRPARVAEPPVSGETFSEQAFSDQTPPVVEVGGGVKIHIVIEHNDPAVVKRVAEHVRALLSQIKEI